jgi:hypothetical protein
MTWDRVYIFRYEKPRTNGIRMLRKVGPEPTNCIKNDNQELYQSD